MRVAVLSLLPVDPQRISGGVRAVARYLLDGLRAYPDLELVAVHCHSDITQDLHLVQDGVPYHYLAQSKRRLVPNMLRSIPRVAAFLREIQPDVVSAHTAPLALAAMRAGVPTLFTNHGLQPVDWWSVHAAGDILRYRLMHYLEGRALRRAKHLVAISAYAQGAYAGRTRGHWRRIANPIPGEFFAVPLHAPDLTAPTLLYAGTINPVKDLLTLLQAVARLRITAPGARLEIAGRVNSPTYEARLRREVEQLGLSESVCWRGLLSRSELLLAYERATAVVLASRWENSPMAIMEGMAAGKPVAATRVGGVPELVAEGETGLLATPRDPEGLAQALRGLLESPARLQAMGARARQVAQERFSLQAVAASYREALYETASM
jgi:glycosyltransferase involved in cell wall biosynthesis